MTTMGRFAFIFFTILIYACPVASSQTARRPELSLELGSPSLLYNIGYEQNILSAQRGEIRGRLGVATIPLIIDSFIDFYSLSASAEVKWLHPFGRGRWKLDNGLGFTYTLLWYAEDCCSDIRLIHARSGLRYYGKRSNYVGLSALALWFTDRNDFDDPIDIAAIVPYGTLSFGFRIGK